MSNVNIISDKFEKEISKFFIWATKNQYNLKDSSKNNVEWSLDILKYIKYDEPCRNKLESLIKSIFEIYNISHNDEEQDDAKLISRNFKDSPIEKSPKKVKEIKIKSPKKNKKEEIKEKNVDEIKPKQVEKEIKEEDVDEIKPKQVKKEIKNESPNKVKDESPKKVKDESPKKVKDESPKKVKDESPKKVKDESPKKVKDESPKKVKDESHEKVKDESHKKVKDESPKKVKGESINTNIEESKIKLNIEESKIKLNITLDTTICTEYIDILEYWTEDLIKAFGIPEEINTCDKKYIYEWRLQLDSKIYSIHNLDNLDNEEEFEDITWCLYGNEKDNMNLLIDYINRAIENKNIDLDFSSLMEHQE